MAIQDTSQTSLATAVRKAGSQVAFGKVIGRRQSTIQTWLAEGKELPAEFVLEVESKLGISRHELRPDLYPIENPPQDPPGQPPAQGEGPASRPAETDNAGGTLSGSNSSDSDPLEGIAA